jgi:hypothetical protein
MDEPTAPTDGKPEFRLVTPEEAIGQSRKAIADGSATIPDLLLAETAEVAYPTRSPEHEIKTVGDLLSLLADVPDDADVADVRVKVTLVDFRDSVLSMIPGMPIAGHLLIRRVDDDDPGLTLYLLTADHVPGDRVGPSKPATSGIMREEPL